MRLHERDDASALPASYGAVQGNGRAFVYNIQKLWQRLTNATYNGPMMLAQKFTMPGVIGEELARALSDAIIFLKYEPGARIIEEEICAEYGLSRSPVREALRILEGEGLAVRIARRGVRAAPMSQANLREVYSCRMALEGLAASEAARNASREILEELRKSLKGMKTAMAAGQVETFFAHNVAFTNGVHRASANGTLQKLLSGIEKQSLRYRYFTHLRNQKMLDLSYEGQGSLLDAVSQGKPALARKRASRLIRDAYLVISQTVAKAYPASETVEAIDLMTLPSRAS
jgi:GntR family transcriptional regulator, rspAB operon transcriptional repressor